jgi:hypothetical protein
MGREDLGGVKSPLSFLNKQYDTINHHTINFCQEKTQPKLGFYFIHFLNKFYSNIKKMNLLKKITGTKISFP